MIDINDISICYLCGEKLDRSITNHKDPQYVNRDHVPPKCFFPKNLRGLLKRLLILPTHNNCNRIFKNSEAYFLALCGLSNSNIANCAWHDVQSSVNTRGGKRTIDKIISGFSDKIGSIYLPNDSKIWQVDEDIVYSVLKKITQGLYFYENFRETGEQKYLSLEKFKLCRFFPPGNSVPTPFNRVLDNPPKGENGGIFEYKFQHVTDKNDFYVWLMCFWNSLIAMTIFDEP